jgi:hypothetical protein
MCNPRRIQVEAVSNLSAAWQEEIVRTAQATGTATGEARVVDDLQAMLSPQAYAQFVRCLAGDRAWTRLDDTYHLDVERGSVMFDPDTGEIELTARLSEHLALEASARREASGTVDATGRAETEAVYYTDGWRNQTRERVEREAQEQVDREAEAQAQRELQAAQDAARLAGRARLRGEESEVEAEARQNAEAELRRRSAERTAVLSRRAEGELESVRRECMAIVNRSVGQAYREAILSYARERGAENIRLTEEDGSISIEFEL